jgi:acyl carrier protein
MDEKIYNNTLLFLKFTATELLIPFDKISLNDEFRGLSTWSSLNALVYISRINEETNVLISSLELADLKTLNDIYNLISSKSNGAI